MKDIIHTLLSKLRFPSSTAKDDELDIFLECAGQGMIAGRVSEWPQLVPACYYAHQRLQALNRIESLVASGVPDSELISRVKEVLSA